MVKKASAASGNGSRRTRTSAAAAAQEAPPPEGGLKWGMTAANGERVGDEGGGFTTDTATGRTPPPDPSVGDGAEINGEDCIWNGEEWVPAAQYANDASQAAEAPPADVKPKRQTKAEKAAAEKAAQTNMTSDLVSGVERMERLMEEISVLKEDAKEVMGELKTKGYTPKIIRQAIRRRAMDPDTRQTEDAMLALYEDALRGA